VSDLIFEEATAEELMDWLGHYEIDAAEELRERFYDLKDHAKRMEVENNSLKRQINDCLDDFMQSYTRLEAENAELKETARAVVALLEEEEVEHE
jgi:hypothetical protein